MRFLQSTAIFVGLTLMSGCATNTANLGTITGVPATNTNGSVQRAALQREQPASVAAFRQVVRHMEPVIERECQALTKGVNCDYSINIDDREGIPSNAYQTERNGRPIIVFTAALIKDANNTNELAFVLGHEAAHHINGHIGRTQQNAVVGALVLGGLTALAGGGQAAVDSAQQIGGQVGARSYSKDFELEADALGTVLTYKAGYDPVRGAEFFNRIPDPGNQFLGTHPPNANRMATVRRVAARLEQ